ncbi:MAG: penicillin-binding protein, partial [Candidatus Dormibacteraeota bacterium]|nr:penicillin-binding protein [Candidatus Dormibacteraeota bacterium]
HVLRDSRGRRLRASAYKGPRRRSTRRGGDLGPSGMRKWWPPVAKVALVAIVAVAAFLASTQGYVTYASNLPNAHVLTEKPLPADTLIYDAGGGVMADIRPTDHAAHYQQDLSQMGTLLPEATVAIEDKGFYQQPGIDPAGIVRAGLADFESNSTQQGASTITQQLAKLELQNGFDGTPTLKIKNIILAIQIEHAYSKKDILGMYLNGVNYGNNSTGAEAAAQNYFRLNTNQLDLAQASMLAGIPRNPNLYGPLVNPTSAKYRQQQVLNAMVKQRMITAAQAKAAFAEPLTFQTEGPTFFQNPAYVNYVMGQMEADFNLTQAQVQNGGYRVYTPYNPGINSIAQTAVTNEAIASGGLGIQQGSATVLDPKTGGVLAMIGTAWPNDPTKYAGNVNWALAPRHPGSSFKILNYTSALNSKALTMSTQIPDGQASYAPEPSWHLTNYETGSYPQCFLAQCWASSENIPAIWTELSQPGGTASVVNMARNMGLNVWDSSCNGPLSGNTAGWPACNGGSMYQDGFSSLFDTTRAPETFGPSLTVGGYDETTVDMAQAAQVEADGGVLHPATSIEKITNADGSLVYQWNPQATGKQVISPQLAWLATTILSKPQYKELGFGSLTQNLVLNGWPAAAKTGTAENWTDSWTVGWDPVLASAFWFGNMNENIGTDNVDAVQIASPAWKYFMDTTLGTMKVSPDLWFPEPSTGIRQVGTNSLGLPNYYLDGTGPNTPRPATAAGLSISRPVAPAPRPFGGGGSRPSRPAPKPKKRG